MAADRNQKIISPKQVRSLQGETIKDIKSVRGRPGGANNDHIQLEFESGKKLDLSIYALYRTVARIDYDAG